MAETFAGIVSITPEGSADVTVTIDGGTGDIVMGGAGGQDGDLILKDAAGETRISLNAHTHRMQFLNASGDLIVDFGLNGNLVMGGAGGVDGDLTLKDGEGETRISLDAESHQMRFFDASGNQVVDLGPNGKLVLGGAGGVDGDLQLNDGAGQSRIYLDAQNQRLRFRDESDNVVLELGPSGNIIAGGAGQADGDLILKDGEGETRISLNAQSHQMLFFDSGGNEILNVGPNGNIVLGGAGDADGDLILKDANGIDRIRLDAETSQITLRDSSGTEIGRVGSTTNLRLGTNGTDGDLLLFPSTATDIDDDGAATIHLDANAGDITLRNADCAEEFEIMPSVAADPGTVMALGPDGRLRPSQRPHEKAVVGVVSGGGHYRPGIVLDRQPGRGVRRPIALVGKAFVRVTDEAGPIEIGDLLTASSIPGVAMRAVDPIQAFGAVIGKAIVPHRQGEGMIPMIIALQ